MSAPGQPMCGHEDTTPEAPSRRRWFSPAGLALLLIRGYQALRATSPYRWCRFEPTCSSYTATAVERFGLARGIYLGFRRILRCNPWSVGGYDPVPEAVRQRA